MSTVLDEQVEQDDWVPQSPFSPPTVSLSIFCVLCQVANNHIRRQASSRLAKYLAGSQAEHRSSSRRNGTLLWRWRRWSRLWSWRSSWRRSWWWLYRFQRCAPRSQPVVKAIAASVIGNTTPGPGDRISLALRRFFTQIIRHMEISDRLVDIRIGV